jgi:hypothetical protein
MTVIVSDDQWYLIRPADLTAQQDTSLMPQDHSHLLGIAVLMESGLVKTKFVKVG